METNWSMQYGIESLLPPLIAITLAILTRRIVVPLAIGVFSGAMLLTLADSRSPVWDTLDLFFRLIYRSIVDFDHLQTLLFTLLLGAMVGVMEIGGGIEALLLKFSRWIGSKRSAQTMIAVSGLAIFFDDYANTLLIGGTMRKTADRFGVSREKLAYLVDSTAAPVAGLSVVSTWSAIEIGYMGDGLREAGITEPSAAFGLFIASIPFRFYPVLAIVMVLLVALTGRDFGAMRVAEENCNEGSDNLASQTEPTSTSAQPKVWLAGVLPILVCVIALVATLYGSGLKKSSGDMASNSLRGLIEVLGNGNAYLSLIVGGALGLATACLSHRFLAICSWNTLFIGTLRGAKQMMPAMVILWFAWALTSITGKDGLHTAQYLSSLLSDRLDPHFLPTIVFLLAGFVAFATGTSWGTMAILTPASISLSLSMAPGSTPSGALCLATAGAVLAGAIFGDHCSPISDTTVLSSRASGCDHLQHVRTQLPYSLVVALVCVLFGTIPSAYGVSPWLCLAVGAIVLAVVVRTIGSRLCL